MRVLEERKDGEEREGEVRGEGRWREREGVRKVGKERENGGKGRVGEER